MISLTIMKIYRSYFSIFFWNCISVSFLAGFSPKNLLFYQYLMLSNRSLLCNPLDELVFQKIILFENFHSKILNLNTFWCMVFMVVLFYSVYSWSTRNYLLTEPSSKKESSTSKRETISIAYPEVPFSP